MPKSETTRYILAVGAALAAIAILMIPEVAAAANAGGTMPYSTGLTRFRDSMSGEVAGALIVIGLVGGCAMWMWGGELSGMLAQIAKIIIIVCIISGGGTALLTALGVTGAVI